MIEARGRPDGQVKLHAGASRRAVLLALMTVPVITGCATPVRVQPLATGRTDVTAYQLLGSDLPELSAQASRLCPDGYQPWMAQQSGTPVAGSAIALWHRTVRAAEGSAQLTIVCPQTPVQAVAASEKAAAKPLWPFMAASGASAPSGATPQVHGEATAELASSQPRDAAPTPLGRGSPGTAPVTGYDR